MRGRSMFERVVSILPREKLEELADVERPWNEQRSKLETIVITKESDELRRELAEFVRSELGVQP